jgi:hypothetical protein
MSGAFLETFSDQGHLRYKKFLLMFFLVINKSGFTDNLKGLTIHLGRST